jgi:hypothetical protein
MLSLSRDVMRTLKAQKDEEIKNMKIDSIIKQIRSGAVQFAETNTDTIYKYMIDTNNNNANHFGGINTPSNCSSKQSIWSQINKENVVENIDEILTRLRSLFPECVVEYKKISLARGRDGKEYDISTLDDKVRPFIDMTYARTNSYIIIDWS